MIETIIIAIGFASLAFAAILDDIRTRQRNQECRERLAILSEELEEADAQCAAYVKTIALERQGNSCDSKKECGKCSR